MSCTCNCYYRVGDGHCSSKLVEMRGWLLDKQFRRNGGVYMVIMPHSFGWSLVTVREVDDSEVDTLDLSIACAEFWVRFGVRFCCCCGQRRGVV